MADSATAPATPPPGVHPLWWALNLYKQRRTEECIPAVSAFLEAYPYDQSAWWIKLRALTSEAWVDDTELEDVGVAELLLDDTAVATCPRPGTSIVRPMTSASGSNSQAIRPVTASGRPVTGFNRPGTAARPGTSMARDVRTAFSGARPGTSRPMTTSGRVARLGTASMRGNKDVFVDPASIDVAKYAGRPEIAKALVDYLLYVGNAPYKAVELCASSSEKERFSDWWWKSRLGKGYYRMGLIREAEQQLASALRHKDGEHVVTYLELAKIFLRQDQPVRALSLLEVAHERFPDDTHVQLAVARTHELVGDHPVAIARYLDVLQRDATNMEAVASVAAHWFYEGHAELSARMYRRLLQLGLRSAELWTNLGLACLYSGQLDVCIGCFDRAIVLAKGDTLADVWYNISHVCIAAGDLTLAYQALKVAVHTNPNHGEAWTNLAALDGRKANAAGTDAARVALATAVRVAPYLHEARYNSALVAYRASDWQTAFNDVTEALALFPEHRESLELMQQLQQHLTTL